MSILCFSGKCLGLGRVADEWNGNVLPIIVMMDPPMNGRFCMCKFLELHLLVLSITCMIAINHVFTHAHVDGMMCHGQSYVCDPSGCVMLPCETGRSDRELSKSGLPNCANVSVPAHVYSAYEQGSSNVLPWSRHEMKDAMRYGGCQFFKHVAGHVNEFQHVSPCDLHVGIANHGMFSFCTMPMLLDTSVEQEGSSNQESHSWSKLVAVDLVGRNAISDQQIFALLKVRGIGSRCEGLILL